MFQCAWVFCTRYKRTRADACIGTSLATRSGSDLCFFALCVLIGESHNNYTKVETIEYFHTLFSGCRNTVLKVENDGDGM